MFETNRQRKKALILANSETRALFYLIRVLIIILILFTIFITVFGKWCNLKEEKIKEKLFGSWNIAVIEVEENQLSYFKKNAFINNYAVQYIQEKNYLNNDIRIVIGSCEEKFLDIASIKLLNGRMPLKNNEVAVEENYLNILGVKNVGDVISINSKVKSLQGFTVCGILSNYSNRWKMVNWNLDYINCFIYKAKVSTLQVFIDVDNFFENDIKINFLNYYNNTELSSISLNKMIFETWVIIILELIIMSLYLSYNFKKRFYRKKTLKLSNTILSFFIIILTVLSMFSIIEFVNDVYSLTNYRTSSWAGKVNYKILSNENVLFSNGKYIIVDSENGDVKKLKYIPDKHIDNIAELIVGAVHIVTLNILIYCLLVIIFQKFFNTNLNRIFLEKYYFNKYIFRKRITSYLLKYYFLELVLSFLINKFRYNTIENLDIREWILFYCIIIFNISFLIRVIFINHYIKKLYNYV